MAAPVKPAIGMDVLDRVDIRLGTILSVTEVPESDIVAGIRKERENPGELEGKQALFVVNLEPRKIRGVVSEGMLFDLGYADKIRPALAVPAWPVPPGTRAG
jgi:tRNA-binding protein